MPIRYLPIVVLLCCLIATAQSTSWNEGVQAARTAQPSDTFWDGNAHIFPLSQTNAFNFFNQSSVGLQGQPSWVSLQQTTNGGTSWTYWSGTKVHRIAITAIGSGYSSPTCTVNNPAGGTAATCTAATTNGAVPSISLTAGGSGYNVAGIKNTVTFSGGGCTTEPTAFAIANAPNSGAIAFLVQQSYGQGCTSAPACAITTTGSGTGATCSAAAPVNGAITSITLSTQGSGYVQGPRVTIFGSTGAGAAGSGAQVTATCCTGGAVTAVNLIAGGSGYGTSPTCTISAVQGSGATCTATASSGVINSVTFGVGGSGYIADPTVTLSGAGSGATARADLNFCTYTDALGCFFSNVGMHEVNIGAGVDTNTSPSTLVACWPEYWSDANFTSDGLFISRSIDSGVSWSTPVQFSNNPAPQINGANWNSCTGVLVVAPPGIYANSSCNANGCIAIDVRDDTDGIEQIWFSYDDGQTWPTKNTLLSETGITDETALLWAGGNKIIGFNRPSANTGQSMWFFQSSDMGSTWTKTSTGFPFINGGTCSLGGTLLTDNQIAPILLTPTLPQSGSFATLIFGERQSCSSPSQNTCNYQALTFNPIGATAGNIGTPQQIISGGLTCNVSVYGYSGAFQNGTKQLYLLTLDQSGQSLLNAQNFQQIMGFWLPGIFSNGTFTLNGTATVK